MARTDPKPPCPHCRNTDPSLIERNFRPDCYWCAVCSRSYTQRQAEEKAER
jgi:hypothetical protein